MKNTILFVFVIGTMLSSCSNNGNKAETGDAENIEVVQTATTTEFHTIEAGSHLEWRASHLGGMEPRFGKISLKDAKVSVTNGQLSNATIQIDMTSLTVENFGDDAESTADLTGHLKNADFFHVDSLPYSISTFELSGIEATEGDFNSIVKGNLTMKGVTKSISFKANVAVTEGGVSIQSEDFSVDRRDWNLTYHVEGSEGVPVNYLIANDIGFTINVGITK